MATPLTNEEPSALVVSLTNQVAALTAAMMPGARTPTPFALSPGRASPEDLIDYTTKLGGSLWDRSTKSLDTPYDMTSKDTVIFTEGLANHAKVHGWSIGPKSIFAFTNDKGNVVNLIKEYGQISLETLTTECAKMIGTGAESETRMSQNNEQCRKCLLATLEPKARARLFTHRATYTITAPNTAGIDEEYILAPLMYKVIMNCATINSKATEATLRGYLTNMPSIMVSVKSNIPDYNSQFDTYHSQLVQRGCTYDAHIQALFDGYLVAQDFEFRVYMKRLYDDWIDERGDMKDITHEKLMSMALNKYNFHVTKHEWGAKSEDEQRIVALTAEMTGLKGQLKLAGQAKDSSKKKWTGKGDSKKQDKPKKGKKSSSNRERQKKDEAWKKTPPKDGDPKTKIVDGKPFQWCIHHMAWALHSSSECRLGQQRTTDQAGASMANSAIPAAVASSSQMSYLAAVAAASRDE